MLKHNKNIVRNALVAAIALSVNSYAQEGMDEDYGIDEIIVTSTKRETSLMETAVAVSAFGQESLDNQGVKNLLDIGDMVPNMQIALSPTDSGVQVVVRGLTSNNFTEIGDPTVAMHFDGLYSPRPQAGLALMYDVERVEISRGPQGTLFGRNSTAGSVNVISARPNFDQQEGKIEVEMGKYAQRTVKGWFNLPVNDKLALRASALKETADTWYNQTPDLFDLAWDTDGDGTTTGAYDVAADGIPNVDQRRNRDVSDSDAYGSVDRSGARLGMRFEPTNDVSLDLIADYFQDKSPGGLSLKDCEKAEGTFFACEQDQYDVSVNTPGEMDMTMLGLRSVLTWDINEDVVFEGRVGYSQQKRSQVHDASTVYADPDHPAYGTMRTWYDDNSAPDGCTGGNGSMVECPNLVNNLPLLESLGYGDVAMQPFSDLSLSTNYSDYRSVVSELQLKSQSDSNLQWIAGVFYMKEDNEIRFDVEDPFCCGVIIPLAQSFVQPERLVESLAGFVQFDYKVNEKLNVTAGYRYTHDTKEDVGGRNYITAGYRQPNIGLYDPADSFWFEGWTRLGIVPTADLNPYQSDVLDGTMGTAGDGFLNRLQYSDNSHKGAWSKGTWKVGFDYLVSDDLFLYGSVATGYKSGGFGDSVDICDCNITDTFDYDPENNITYELGFKATMLDGKLNLLGNVFVMDNTDLQDTFYATITGVGAEIQVPADYDDTEGRTDVCTTGEGDCVIVGRDIGTLITQNIGETRNMGVELEFDWRPYNGGRVNGWVAWLDSEITELDNSQDNWFCLERALLGLTNCPDKTTRTIDGNDIEGRYQSFIGNAMPWSPEYSATVTYEHNWYLHNGMRLSPIVSAHWQDEMFFDKGNFDEGALHSGQDAYATADVALRLINEESAWAVELYVRNVTDEVVRNWADRGPGFMRASLGKPRHYGVKFNMAF
ncbi:TonB-dependent receptor [Porticoccaceae bacterium]|nr:TonB-dependent receptor [Porticoccaceae bacterium]